MRLSLAYPTGRVRRIINYNFKILRFRNQNKKPGNGRLSGKRRINIEATGPSNHKDGHVLI